MGATGLGLIRCQASRPALPRARSPASTIFRHFWYVAPARRRPRRTEIEPKSPLHDQYSGPQTSRRPRGTMDNSWTRNQFLFSFQGRINRARYWYALFASMISCLVFLILLAVALGAIFGAGVKSVDLNTFGVFNDSPSLPFKANFNGAGPASPVSLLFY